ncbi:MAG: hypothetical protein KC519_11020 [Anaerolineae bacterium]|nr:hypothetical protein [Anaerolineae bacterium]
MGILLLVFSASALAQQEDVASPVKVNVADQPSMVYGPDNSEFGIIFGPNEPDRAEQNLLTHYAIIPDVWQALPESAAKYEVLFTHATTVVQTCTYGFGGGIQITRQRVTVGVTLINLETEATIASEEFIGLEPRNCPLETTFGGGITGDLPPESDVYDWLMTELMELPFTAPTNELAYGASVTIDGSGFTDLPVTFAGTDGDAVTITVDRNGPSNASLTLALYDPAGQELVRVNAPGRATFPAIEAFNLPETGNYVVRLQSRFENPLFGDFQISLERTEAQTLTSEWRRLRFQGDGVGLISNVMTVMVEAGETQTISVEVTEPISVLNLEIFEPGQREGTFSDLSFSVYSDPAEYRFTAATFSFIPAHSGTARVIFEAYSVSYDQFDVLVRADQAEIDPLTGDSQTLAFVDRGGEEITVPISVEKFQMYTITLQSDAVVAGIIAIDLSGANTYVSNFEATGFVRSSYSFVAQETEVLNAGFSATVLDPFDLNVKVE